MPGRITSRLLGLALLTPGPTPAAAPPRARSGADAAPTPLPRRLASLQQSLRASLQQSLRPYIQQSLRASPQHSPPGLRPPPPRRGRAIPGPEASAARSRGTRAPPQRPRRPRLPGGASTRPRPAPAPACPQPPRSDRGARRRPRPTLSRTPQEILMCPSITIMNPQKSVYGPRSAVRGSGIAWPALSTLVTGVPPGLCVHIPSLPLRYQWKS
jgi:hypothetical protein